MVIFDVKLWVLLVRKREELKVVWWVGFILVNKDRDYREK